jgi:hypothetical protein
MLVVSLKLGYNKTRSASDLAVPEREANNSIANTRLEFIYEFEVFPIPTKSGLIFPKWAKQVALLFR